MILGVYILSLISTTYIGYYIGPIVLVLAYFYPRNIMGLLIGFFIGIYTKYDVAQSTPGSEAYDTGEVHSRISVKGAKLISHGKSFYWPNAGDYVGCKVKLTGQWRPAYTQRNPGGFSEASWLYRHGIKAVWLEKQVQVVTCNTSIKDKIWLDLKQKLMEIPMINRPEIESLLLGRSSLKPIFWYQLGLVHLLAISGMHIRIMGDICQRCFIIFGARWSGNIACLLTWLYVLFLGSPISALRSWLNMVAVRYNLLNLGPYNRFLCVVAIVLSLDPLAIYDMGFWMSFTASGTILVCRRSKTSITLSMFLSLGAISIVFNQPLQPMSLFANWVIMPLFISVFMPLTFMGGVMLYSHSYTAKVLLTTADQVMSTLASLLSLLHQHSPFILILTTDRIVSISVLLLLIIYLRSTIWLTLLLCINISYSSLDPGQVAVSTLSVGHGMAILISTQKHHLLYDCGSMTIPNIADDVVLPYLVQERIKKLNAIVISHPDHDHKSGLAALLSALSVDKLWVSIPLAEDHPQTLCNQGISWTWDNVHFAFIHPDQQMFWRGNNHSCVLKVTGLNGSILLTGDIEKKAQKHLLEHNKPNLKATVLVAPHHGRASAYLQDFVNAVDPEDVIISDISRNMKQAKTHYLKGKSPYYQRTL